MCMYIHSQLYTLHYQEWKSEVTAHKLPVTCTSWQGVAYYLYRYTSNYIKNRTYDADPENLI